MVTYLFTLAPELPNSVSTSNLFFLLNCRGAGDQVCGGNELSTCYIRFPGRMSEKDKCLLDATVRCLKKTPEDALELLKEELSRHPNSMWAHLLYGATCYQLDRGDDEIETALACSLIINPNCLSSWQILYKIYLKNGSFFNPDNHLVLKSTMTALLLLEDDMDAWKSYVGHLWSYLTKTGRFDNDEIVGLVGPSLHSTNADKSAVAAKFVIACCSKANKVVGPTHNELIKSYIIYMKSTRDMDIRVGVFISASKFLIRSACYIGFRDMLVQAHKLILWRNYRLKNFLVSSMYILFVKLQNEVFPAMRAVAPVFDEYKIHLYSNPHLKVVSGLKTILDNRLDAFSAVFNKSYPVSSLESVVYMKSLQKLHYWRELYEVATRHYIFNPSHEKQILTEKQQWNSILHILCRKKSVMGRRFVRELGFKYLRTYGFSGDILFLLAGLSILNKDRKTSNALMKKLIDLGYTRAVVYLKALDESNLKTKLNYLKLIPNTEQTKLLTTSAYLGVGKPHDAAKTMLKMVLKSMAIYIPYEWLGLYYFEKNDFARAESFMAQSMKYHKNSWVWVNFILHSFKDKIIFWKMDLLISTIVERGPIDRRMVSLLFFYCGLRYLSHPEKHSDYFKASELLRRGSTFYNHPGSSLLVADSLSSYGNHETAIRFYEEGVDHDMYSAAMYANLLKMCSSKLGLYVPRSREIASRYNMSIIPLIKYAGVLLDRATSFCVCSNYSRAILFVQMAIFINMRCLSINANVITVWKLMGDLFQLCGRIEEEYSTIYVPSWFVRTEKTVSDQMVAVNRCDSLLLSVRCYSTALKLCKERGKEVEKDICPIIYMSLSHVYAYIDILTSNRKMSVWSLKYALDSIRKNVWEPLNLIGALLGRFGRLRPGYLWFDRAFAVGFCQRAREPECNLGMILYHVGRPIDVFDAYMLRRGMNPGDDVIWLYYIRFYLSTNRKNVALVHLMYQLTRIHHHPTLTDAKLYLLLLAYFQSTQGFGYSRTNLDEIEERLLSVFQLLNSENFIFSKFIGESHFPHRTVEMNVFGYWAYGIHNERCGQLSYARKNYIEMKKKLTVDIVQKSDFRTELLKWVNRKLEVLPMTNCI